MHLLWCYESQIKKNASSEQVQNKQKSKVEGPTVCPIFELSQGSHIKVNCSNDVQLHTLIDTGANCISLNAFNSLSQSDKTDIEKQSYTHATSAGGSPVQIQDVASISFKLRKSSYKTKVYVVQDLIVDLILGTKFLEQEGAVIDFSKGQFNLHDRYNMFMSEDFTLDGGCEAIVLSTIKGNLPNEVDGLVKPGSVINSRGLFMANSILWHNKGKSSSHSSLQSF